ncbi:phage integrase SAM-like domain-containing protein [Nocardia sp. GP40]|uniref:phage integrase SAM-like domain-containing protein n=1 Tax=Nocardia sp. GP40 TaxID=3156268 RepID=UPI003D244D60
MASPFQLGHYVCQQSDISHADGTAGSVRSHTESIDVTFEEYAHKWVEWRQRHLASSTVATYVGIIQRHFLPALGHLRLCEISDRIVSRWREELRSAGCSDASLRAYWALLRIILESAVNDRWIERNPMSPISLHDLRSHQEG